MCVYVVCTHDNGGAKGEPTGVVAVGTWQGDWGKNGTHAMPRCQTVTKRAKGGGGTLGLGGSWVQGGQGHDNSEEDNEKPSKQPELGDMGWGLRHLLGLALSLSPPTPHP